MTIRITGTGSALPEKILTNFDLEKMVDTSDEWIQERTGIRERRIAQGDTVVSLATKACQAALERAGKKAEEVDLILVATCTPELLFPCCACQVQENLGAKNAACFDLNGACAGFLFALGTAYAYINSGVYHNALVVGSEILSKLVDFTDRSSCVLFGDGSGAVFVEEAPEGKGLLSLVQGANGSMGSVLNCETQGHDHIHMEGREVYKFATRQVPLCIEEALAKAGLQAGDIDFFFLHQANLRILEAIAKRLGVSMEKVPVNLDRYGNISSATIPVLLDEISRRGIIKVGQKIVLSGFGAGLTYGACVFAWE
ncbi:MAG: ketoacyl-ACP synthase III [Lachnospiraceae bacterium]|nr:ketoacyl-ACP synthase III [Lachnospiraceae bacterium]